MEKLNKFLENNTSIKSSRHPIDHWMVSDAIDIYYNLEQHNWAPWLAAPIPSLERQSQNFS